MLYILVFSNIFLLVAVFYFAYKYETAKEDVHYISELRFFETDRLKHQITFLIGKVGRQKSELRRLNKAIDKIRKESSINESEN